MEEMRTSEETERCVVLYYAYVAIEDVSGAAAEQARTAQALALAGRIRVAAEGINGTVSGNAHALRAYCEATEKLLRRSEIDWKWSRLEDRTPPFEDLEVKVVKDLVGAEGRAGQYSTKRTATHLEPEEFHERLAEAGENVALIDVRNTYEYQVGHFQGAIDPETRKYAEFEAWFRDKGADLVKGKDTVLMYCTGGIRCERASIVVREILEEKASSSGKLPQLFQLKGGIHRYLEAFEPSESKFLGRNFVFDGRVTQPLQSKELEDQVVTVGRCGYCDLPWDTIKFDRRCEKCRMLVLACDSCADHTDGVYCNLHMYLDPRRASLVDVRKRKAALHERLEPFANGRKFKNKRHIISKQLRELETVEARLLSPSNACKEIGSPPEGCCNGIEHK